MDADIQLDEPEDVGWQPSSAAGLRAQAGIQVSPKLDVILTTVGHALLGVPLAGFAWFLHGIEIGGAVLVVELCLLTSWQVSRHRAAMLHFDGRKRTGRFRRFAVTALGAGATTWCITVSTTWQGTLLDAAQTATVTGLAIGVGTLYMPAWFSRISARSKADSQARREQRRNDRNRAKSG